MSWSVLRQDDNGNTFLVRENLTKEESEDLVEDLTSKGHKQVYWVSNANILTITSSNDGYHD